MENFSKLEHICDWDTKEINQYMYTYPHIYRNFYILAFSVVFSDKAFYFAPDPFEQSPPTPPGQLLIYRNQKKIL